MPTPEFIAVHAQLAGEVRTETLMGQEYRVVPASLVRAQVLNNNLGATFLPPEEITEAWAQVWNGMPIITGDHPTVQGKPTIARDPSILNARGVGFLFAAQASGEGSNRKLSAEAWLNTSRAEAVPDLGVILGKLDRGEPVELSTGFPTVVEDLAGNHEGKAYTKVLRPRGADHLAIFAEGLGACSINDGCGLGLNHAGNCSTAPEPPATRVKEDPITTEQEQVTNTDPAPSKSWLRRMVDRFAQSLALFPEEAAQNQSDEERRRLISGALQEAFGNKDTFTWVEAVHSDEGYVIFEQEKRDEASVLLRVDFTISDEAVVEFTSDPTEVRRVVSYEPVAGDGPGDASGGAMNREEMIAQLAQTGPLGAEALNKLTDCDLKALIGNSKPAAAQEPAAPRAEPKTEEAAQEEPATNAELAELVQSLSAQITGLQEKISVLETATAPAVAERERERELLVRELAGNARVLAVHSREELEGMTLDGLRKVRALSRGESYAGRGGPQVSTNQSTPAYAEPVPYWQQAANTKEN